MLVELITVYKLIITTTVFGFNIETTHKEFISKDSCITYMKEYVKSEKHDQLFTKSYSCESHQKTQHYMIFGD